MADWSDRIREAVYRSKSGKEIPLIYEDVSQIMEKKTTAFTYPDGEGTFVQDKGNMGRRFPMRIFFWGADYDNQALEFEAALEERGVGQLEHPIYGVRNVIPFGAITRTDRLKNGANECRFDIVFWDTIDVFYPTSQADPESEIKEAIDNYVKASAEQFANSTSLDSTVEQATLRGGYKALVNEVQEALQPIADTVEAVQNTFNLVNDSINASITALVGDPLTLVFQTAILIDAPARANALISDRLSAYQNLLDSLTTGPNAIATPTLDSEALNEFLTKDVFASTYLTGSVVSVTNNQFNAKTDALSTAEALLTQLDQLIVWRDDNYAALEAIDTGEAYQFLLQSVALTTGFLVELSFDLKQERRFTLDRARTMIDLTAELYGSIDDQLDFFIDSNNLTGSEILEIQAGREIVYYV